MSKTTAKKNADSASALGMVGGAATGAAAGSLIGPLGAAVGAVVGGVAGANAKEIAERMPKSMPKLIGGTAAKPKSEKSRRSGSTKAAQRASSKGKANKPKARKA
jgi:hypothetical protein